jgi:hypothetical protein
MFSCNFKKLPSLLIFMLTIGLFACDTNTQPNTKRLQGSIKLELTDAPIDDPTIQAFFVTIKEIHINGEPWEAFQSKKTVDLLSLQNGLTEVLATGELDAGTYSRVELVLDHESDEDGQTPGTYILNNADTKLRISPEAQTIVPATQNFECIENSTTAVVYDLDLRKLLTYDPETSSGYAFVTDFELEKVGRVIEKDLSGSISGKVTMNIPTYQDYIVFAYPENGFDPKNAFEGKGPSLIRFAEAITSSGIDENGNYHLSFLPVGTYEIVLAAYKDVDVDGRLDPVGHAKTNNQDESSSSIVTLQKGEEKKYDISSNEIIKFEEKRQ